MLVVVGALQGLLVLDWTIWQMGPVATAMLADMGADVIHIEAKGSGDPGRALKRSQGMSLELPRGRNAYFENNNRNKRSFSVDLSKERGRDVIYHLVRKADVFVQNFRYGVATRLGMDYETLSGHNPRLIYASGTGYGPNGPDRAEPVMDWVGLARSGIMPYLGEPGTPPSGIPGGLADQMGAIMLALGIMAGIVARERLGIGQKVDSSHLGSMVFLQGFPVALWGMAGVELARKGRRHCANPLWNHYQCADGRWLAFAHSQSERHWPDFCRIIGREDLIQDPRFIDPEAREHNACELVDIFDGIFVTKTREDWNAILRAHGGFVFGPVNSIPDLFEDVQVKVNNYIADFEHPVLGPTKLAGFPLQFSETPCSIRSAAPEAGQHTEEILTELCGYSWEEIGQLQNEGVI